MRYILSIILEKRFWKGHTQSEIKSSDKKYDGISITVLKEIHLIINSKMRII